ncbi:MAG TPA: hypothetical protein DCZ94_21680 [Lentisphaeria bacterium]|nr:MAG: hypothetical protein A2X48_14610 [Lentisphaerae bacterium GWF2_49_21]HBC89557.1 hypothetical protein [Lentisphaeria bacterium]
MRPSTRDALLALLRMDNEVKPEQIAAVQAVAENMPILISEGDAAKIIGKPRTTLNSWRLNKKGRIPFPFTVRPCPISKGVLYNEIEVRAWVRNFFFEGKVKK